VDREALGDLFNQYDSDKSGTITLDELETMLSHLGVGTYLPSISISIALLHF
jgi:Ca2+-binding EF-hand superfamily protein